jgi:hypothetical protein
MQETADNCTRQLTLTTGFVIPTVTARPLSGLINRCVSLIARVTDFTARSGPDRRLHLATGDLSSLVGDPVSLGGDNLLYEGVRLRLPEIKRPNQKNQSAVRLNAFLTFRI